MELGQGTHSEGGSMLNASSYVPYAKPLPSFLHFFFFWLFP